MASDTLTAERIFERFFLPLYPPGALADLGRARARDANPGGDPAAFAHLDEAAEIFARLAPEALSAPRLVLDFTDASVHRLAHALTRERRDALIAARRDGAPPMLVTLVTHGALYVGACVVRGHGGAWGARQPLWESLVRLESSAGTADLPIFHWWLKALADDEIGDGRLADRYRTHVEVPTFDASRLRVIAPADRRVPRLDPHCSESAERTSCDRVRWDGLRAHLRAHLPELRDLGPDFPSPERLDELAFERLDFTLLGGGRMLLAHGPTPRGLHLLWLDAAGFAKAAYYPADAFPAPVVQVDGDKLRVIVSVQQRQQVHEMLWWGA